MVSLPGHPKLYVAPSTIQGAGLYSKVRFGVGDVLFHLAGSYAEERYDENYEVGPGWFSIGLERWLIPHERNPGSFLNHSCAANAQFRDDLSIVALRAIAPHTEILIDYSTTELDPYWKMECRCGAKTCRRVIRPFYQVKGRARQRVLSATPSILRECVAKLAVRKI